MIEHKVLYQHMTKISERYVNLKSIFNNFYKLATDQLTNKDCPVKGIAFSPMLEKNCFDVSFAGEKVRFSFFVVTTEFHSLRGVVRCNPINRDEKPVDKMIEEFSFDRYADSTLKTSDGDPLRIDAQAVAGYVVLHFLMDALNKMTGTLNAPHDL